MALSRRRRCAACPRTPAPALSKHTTEKPASARSESRPRHIRRASHLHIIRTLPTSGLDDMHHFVTQRDRFGEIVGSGLTQHLTDLTDTSPGAAACVLVVAMYTGRYTGSISLAVQCECECECDHRDRLEPTTRLA